MTRCRLGSLGAIAAVVLLIGALTLNRLGAADVCGSNEAVEAVAVQQMVERGVVLFPLDNGRDPMYKPPLFHWTALGLDRLLGLRRVTEFNLRLPSALYATAGAALTMALALGLLGLRGAVLSGMILAASYQYISQGRFGRVDMTLTFFESLALFAFLWWLDPAADEARPPCPSRRLLPHYLLALALGLGVLAKGPVGALLPGLAIVGFLVLERRWKELRALIRPGPVVLGALLASSWYLTCLLAGRYGFLNRQIASENFGRFLGALGRMPAFYYVGPLLLNSTPLSLLVPVAVASALGGYREAWRGGGRARLEPAEVAARLFAIFWIVTVVFFELAAYKRKAYLLPLWPASAVMLSWWVQKRAVPRFGERAYRAVIATCAALVVINFFFIPWHEVRGCGATISLAEALAWPFEELAARRADRFDQPASFRTAAAQIDRVVPRGEPLYVFGFDQALEPLIFYLGRNAPPFTRPLADAPAGYVIVPGALWARDSAATPDFQSALTAPHGKAGLVLLRRAR